MECSDMVIAVLKPIKFFRFSVKSSSGVFVFLCVYFFYLRYKKY